jgi:glyoxylase-like metal-dependent hydrolase (beta-lactamase superfamily II)
VRIAPGLHRIGNDLVAFHLVVTDDGLTLVDAGVPGHWSELLAELDAIGRSVDEIRGVVLTHGDSDHIGVAERLRRDHGVAIHVHEADAPRARGEVKKANAGMGRFKIGPLLRFLWYAGRRGGLRTRWLTEVTTFGDGAVLDLPGSPRIVGLPGHTPGSVAVHVPGVDAVFVGDALTTGHVLTGQPGPQPAPFTLDPDGAMASLDRLAAIPATWVVPGHGAPFRGGTTEVVRLIREAAAGAPGA